MTSVPEESPDLEASMQDFVEEMVEHLQWSLSVQVAAPDEDTIVVDLSGEDRDLLLVDRAEVLEVFQYLLNRIFGRDADDRRIVVDCDGYRARKEAELREIALRVSERVRRTGNAEELGLMNPYERRIVHLAVAESEGVTTESEGEGVMKRVVIFPE
jgi:spoIIIJ-associated protein